MKSISIHAGAVVLTAIMFARFGFADDRPFDPKLTYTSLFSLDHKIGAFEAPSKTLHILDRVGDQLREVDTISVAGNVWVATKISTGYAIATGFGRGDLTAPLRVTLTDEKGSNAKQIFEHSGERTQASYLAWRDGKLWFTYFDSKYMTKTGYFSQSNGNSWKFVESFTTRLGDAVDVLKDKIVVGRPYGEPQGQDGDVSIYGGGERIDLPSYRGVRSVAFFGDPSDPMIALGDGWHQNYGQLAQGRLSILKRDPVSGRYALQLIDRDSTQYGLSKIVPFALRGKTYLAALGNKSFNVFGPQEKWEKSSLYTRTTEDALFDFAFLGVEKETAWFAILDQTIHLIKFDASPQ